MHSKWMTSDMDAPRMLDLNAFKMFESVLDASRMFGLVPKDRRRPQDARKAKSRRGGAGAQHWHRRPLQLLPAEVSVVLTDANLGASQLWQRRAGESDFSEEFLQQLARTTRARPGTGKRRPLELDRAVG